MKNTMIRYHFSKTDNSREDFKFELSAASLELISNIPDHPPIWTELDFHQCSNCPLDVASHPHCPLAVNMVNIVNRFEDLISYDKIRVDVTTEERCISQITTAQLGISSMLGLVIATCGCPHAAFFRPMARFHLPLASKEETIFRATSMYMLAQYFLKKAGQFADFELHGLTSIYDNMQIVNIAIVARLRAATKTDSSINAIVILDNYAKYLPYAIEKSLQDIRYLFSRFLSN
ncbi:MAG: hypothetical protein JSW26_01345 [Desulfobacterales bacterium]|nr:MAG: hypothetical protein JSW26_01345 [Desulfobacterales bacterium]